MFASVPAQVATNASAATPTLLLVVVDAAMKEPSAPVPSRLARPIAVLPKFAQ
jgi:hypothetical protein